MWQREVEQTSRRIRPANRATANKPTVRRAPAGAFDAEVGRCSGPDEGDEPMARSGGSAAMPKRETPGPAIRVISVFLANANELSVVRGPLSDSRGVGAYVESVTSVCYGKARRSRGARASRYRHAGNCGLILSAPTLRMAPMTPPMRRSLAAITSEWHVPDSAAKSADTDTKRAARRISKIEESLTCNSE